ncbi:hypothetical protein AbraIFM66951_003771 [Aspergillus brasiliensis]|uniref:Chromatin assembly factor 1 subunit A n=1 Tax=Aspergillus brasiliensis TaxID=319629 RepID=A0A9W5YLP6_9EURO|nr:hypothetical protein AbraCBS73388_004509 [Aspergillus brasiliensis]GKZ43217.1 hypothetical protein AbraIFM66951_003771 [Aspergillus brasiliensis]
MSTDTATATAPPNSARASSPNSSASSLSSLSSPPSDTNTYPASISMSVSPARKRSIGDVDGDGDASVAAKGGNDVKADTTTNVEMKVDGDTRADTDDNKENQDAQMKSCGPGGDEKKASVVGDSAATTTAAPAAKKRKLSPASKEAKQQEKEAKERQKLEEKAKKEEEKAKKEEEKAKKEEEKRKREAEKEEEKRVKEEEKRAKEEEKKKREAEKEEERKKKEEKRKAKEEEKAAKEEEKRKKEEEKLKKERAQMKLNSFFAKPKTPAQPSSSNTTLSPSKPTGAGALNDPSHDSGSTVSDYQRAFPDFFLQSHTTLAPPHRFQRDNEALQHTREKVDAYLRSAKDGKHEPLIFRPSEIFQLMPYQRRRGRLPASVKQILSQMQNLADQSETSEAVQRARDLLRQVKMKSLKFSEDVRPPYQGTYSKSLPESSVRRIMRNPFRRGLPETNYDYDSEAEWEEPEEGEDLDSEEEEEGSEDGEDDMDGFLDDEDDHPLDGKRRLIVGDLEPVNTGIRWQEHGVDPELQVYKMETISDSVTFPIDPFSTAYWQKPKAAAEPAQAAGLGRTLHAFMGNNPSSSISHKPTGSGPGADGGSLAVLTAGRTKRTLQPEQLEEFKQVVNGSDLTKMGLIEILKKRFPKVSKDSLKDTLNSVATRVGQKEADKKWVCN